MQSFDQYKKHLELATEGGHGRAAYNLGDVSILVLFFCFCFFLFLFVFVFVCLFVFV